MPMAGFGDHMPAALARTATGPHIAMAIGHGVRLMVGPGLDMSHGDGRLITTGVGSTTTITGPGVRAVSTTAIEVGGDPRWFHSTSTITIAIGIHSIITIAIRARDTATR